MTTPFPLSPAQDPPSAAPTYSVELANRALPLVRRIVADLVTDYRAWQAAVQEFEALVAPSPSGLGATPPDAHAIAVQRTARRLAADVQGYLGELAALGVQCKSLEDGLIDFPGEIDGEPALLCWKHGEPDVAWWHAPEAGFAGRRPIAPVEVAR